MQQSRSGRLWDLGEPKNSGLAFSEQQLLRSSQLFPFGKRALSVARVFEEWLDIYIFNVKSFQILNYCFKQNSCEPYSAQLQVCDPWGRQILKNVELFNSKGGNYTLKQK